MATELDVLRAIAARTKKRGTSRFGEYLSRFSHWSKLESQAAAYDLGNQNKKHQERVRMKPRKSHSARLTSGADMCDAEPQRQQRGTGESAKGWSWADLP
jgi:hypothetical protein